MPNYLSKWVTGFQPNLSKSEGSWFDSVPSSCSEKGVLKGNPQIFTLTLLFPMPKTHSSGHIPLFPTYHNTNITSSYSIRGKASQLNICLKVDIILHQTEQVKNLFKAHPCPCLKNKDLSPFSACYLKDTPHNFTWIKVSKLYPQTSNLFVTHLSASHAETSQLDFGIYL